MTFFRKFLQTEVAIALLFALPTTLAAENLGKAQKKELEAQAKGIVAEAKSLEKSGRLAEARAKYAESQAMIEVKEAAEAIKRLDDEIHKRTKDALNHSRKLYEAHKYKEAVSALEESTKLGGLEGVLSFNLALCYYQLGDRSKAVENLDKAVLHQSRNQGSTFRQRRLHLLQATTRDLTDAFISKGESDVP